MPINAFELDRDSEQVSARRIWTRPSAGSFARRHRRTRVFRTRVFHARVFGRREPNDFLDVALLTSCNLFDLNAASRATDAKPVSSSL